MNLFPELPTYEDVYKATVYAAQELGRRDPKHYLLRFALIKDRFENPSVVDFDMLAFKYFVSPPKDNRSPEGEIQIKKDLLVVWGGEIRRALVAISRKRSEQAMLEERLDSLAPVGNDCSFRAE